MNGEISKNQELHLENREALSLSGVLDILGFEDTNLLVRTELGDLNIDGNDLRVKELSLESGRLLLQGKIDGIYYISSSEKKKGACSGEKADVSGQQKGTGAVSVACLFPWRIHWFFLSSIRFFPSCVPKNRRKEKKTLLPHRLDSSRPSFLSYGGIPEYPDDLQCQQRTGTACGSYGRIAWIAWPPGLKTEGLST